MYIFYKPWKSINQLDEMHAFNISEGNRIDVVDDPITQEPGRHLLTALIANNPNILMPTPIKLVSQAGIQIKNFPEHFDRKFCKILRMQKNVCQKTKKIEL